MKFVQILVSVGLIALLVAANRVWSANSADQLGGLSIFGWVGIAVFMLGVGLVVALGDITRAFGFFTQRDAKANPIAPVRRLEPAELEELGLKKYKGPSYPHPVIFADRCIGCQACVDACPHDVLAIMNGRAAVVAADQCMEDTACQVECPVNPKACIVINTAKEVRSRPAPTRDAATFMTNVPGCYIIGDVSGVPLIKNAVKEGGEVIEYIAAELKDAAPEPKADYDVAIIGIGPGGASAAMTAHEKGLRYVGIEQDQILSTIAMYPKGKYVFFKPDTKDWFGGLSVAGLGLAKAKYDTDKTADGNKTFASALNTEMETVGAEQAELLGGELLPKIPSALHAEFTPLLIEKAKKSVKSDFERYLSEKSGRDAGSLAADEWLALYQRHFAALDQAKKDEVLAVMRRELAETLQRKIPGDQRERILGVWLGGLQQKGVKINEGESCKSIKPAEDGSYFTIKTEQGTAKTPVTYKARRVVLAIGLRGSPNKLRLSNEDMKISLNGGEPENKVLYALSNPSEYKGRDLIIVGGGNSAVEAAVDLVATRDGSNITPRPPGETNRVTLLVRTCLATTVKFGNKLQMYQCMDDGILDVKFGVAIKEMREREVVIMDTETKKELGTIPNDYIFALIGGERPDKFLEGIGISLTKK